VDPPLADSDLRRTCLQVFAVAVLVRVAFGFTALPTALTELHLWQESDSRTFLAVARQILDGDVWVVHPFHPYHLWHRQIADEATWHRWFGPHGFHQAPGYYYLLALLLLVTGGHLWAVSCIQLLLGAFNAVVMTAAGHLIGGRPAAVTAGLLAACYGPYVAVEGLILRDGPALLLSSGAVLLALSADAAQPPLALRRWMACGAVLALGAVFKETGVVLAGAVLLWAAMLQGMRGQWTVGGPLGALLAGFVLGLVPLVIRNVVVDASPFSLSSQGATNILLGNAPGSPLGGRLFGIPPEFREVMDTCDARALCALVELTRRWSGNLGGFWEALLGKAALVWRNVEVADNYSHAYMQARSSVIRVLPVFVCVSLPGLLGLGLTAVRARTNPLLRPTLLLLVLSLVAQAGALSFAAVMARYRLVVVMPLMLATAWLASQVTAWFRAGSMRPLGLTAAGLAALLLAWWAVPPDGPAQSRALRAEDFMLGAHILASRGDGEGAMAELEDGIRFCGDNASCQAPLRKRRLQLTQLQGVPPDPLDVQAVSRMAPDDPAAHQQMNPSP
jgi:4-amino-4-deoxy-L-arabinose transferase-like glycosyltransferase